VQSFSNWSTILFRVLATDNHNFPFCGVSTTTFCPVLPFSSMSVIFSHPLLYVIHPMTFRLPLIQLASIVQQRVAVGPGNAHCMSIRQVSLRRGMCGHCSVARRCCCCRYCCRCYCSAAAADAAD